MNLQRSSYLFSWHFCETARDRAYHSFIYIWENKGLSESGGDSGHLSLKSYHIHLARSEHEMTNYISIYFKDGVWKQFVTKKVEALRGKICLSDPLWNDIGIIRKKNLHPPKKLYQSTIHMPQPWRDSSYTTVQIRAAWRKREHQIIIFPWEKI